MELKAMTEPLTALERQDRDESRKSAAEYTVLADFAQRCIDITCSPIEGDTLRQSADHLHEFVLSWPHWKDGLLDLSKVR